MIESNLCNWPAIWFRAGYLCGGRLLRFDRFLVNGTLSLRMCREFSPHLAEKHTIDAKSLEKWSYLTGEIRS